MVHYIPTVYCLYNVIKQYTSKLVRTTRSCCTERSVFVFEFRHPALAIGLRHYIFDFEGFDTLRSSSEFFILFSSLDINSQILALCLRLRTLAPLW